MSSLIKNSSFEIAATLGDPTSIGPEVGIKALLHFLKTRPRACVHLFAPRTLVPKKISRLVKTHDPENSQTFVPGKPSGASAARALRDLDRAIEFCLRSKQCALVTGPLDKFFCAKVLPRFTGHTDYLKRKTRAKGTTMLLSGKKLKVSLVTTHLPLKKVAQELTREKIVETSLRTHAYLKAGSLRPQLAVLGLNPHASDKGLFGNEEKNIIAPAIETLKKRGISASGPFSPDSFFHRASDFDAVICMYHDQGLIPLKMLHFYDAVNITLGLPFLRVSVDHGTAFDIAGKNKASSLSYVNALNTAYAFLQKSRPY